MTTKDQVFKLASQHPDWDCRQIGEKLKCHPAYVRSCFQRVGLRPPRSKIRNVQAIERRIQELERRLVMARAELVYAREAANA